MDDAMRQLSAYKGKPLLFLSVILREGVNPSPTLTFHLIPYTFYSHLSFPDFPLLPAQISPFDLLIRREFFRIFFQNDFTGFDNIPPVGNF